MKTRYLPGLGEKLQDWLDGLSDGLNRVDEKALKKISNSKILNKVSPVLIMATYFGDGYLWGLLAFALIFLGGQKEQNYILIGLAIAVINIALFKLIKASLRRPRPMIDLRKVELSYRVIDDFAFPSGHATIAFGISYLIVQSYSGFLWAPAGAYFASSLIALSRIFVKEHYPSDVVAGAMLGTLVSFAALPLLRMIVF